MQVYTAPLRDMRFVLFDLLQAEAELAALPRHAGLDRETIEAVLEEGAKFASQVIQPLNAVGDREGFSFHGDGVVTAPAGFKEAYRQFVEAGAAAAQPGFSDGGPNSARTVSMVSAWSADLSSR